MYRFCNVNKAKSMNSKSDSRCQSVWAIWMSDIGRLCKWINFEREIHMRTLLIESAQDQKKNEVTHKLNMDIEEAMIWKLKSDRDMHTIISLTLRGNCTIFRPKWLSRYNNEKSSTHVVRLNKWSKSSPLKLWSNVFYYCFCSLLWFLINSVIVWWFSWVAYIKRNCLEQPHRWTNKKIALPTIVAIALLFVVTASLCMYVCSLIHEY